MYYSEISLCDIGIRVKVSIHAALSVQKWVQNEEKQPYIEFFDDNLPCLSNLYYKQKAFIMRGGTIFDWTFKYILKKEKKNFLSWLLIAFTMCLFITLRPMRPENLSRSFRYFRIDAACTRPKLAPAAGQGSRFSWLLCCLTRLQCLPFSLSLFQPRAVAAYPSSGC